MRIFCVRLLLLRQKKKLIMHYDEMFSFVHSAAAWATKIAHMNHGEDDNGVYDMLMQLMEMHMQSLDVNDDQMSDLGMWKWYYNISYAIRHRTTISFGVEIM